MVISNHARFSWRIIAAFVCLVWVIVLLVNLVLDLFPSRGFIPLFLRHIFMGMTIVGTGILIFFPLQFYLYAGLCCFWGLINIIDGGGLSGLLMYALGLIFALRMGFFKTRPAFKLGIGGLVVIGALLSQIQYGMGHFTGNLLECLELFVIAGLAAALFHRELAAIVKNPEAPGQAEFARAFSVTGTELRLDRDHFTARDFLILRKIFAGEKYESIASGQGMGLSTLKKRLVSLFSLLEVRDRVQFLGRYGSLALVWDERQQGGAEQTETGVVEFRSRS
ncbi:MAG: hypothetical protein LBP20_05930 [Treponema sp.]|jgi:hypothetical protein|nr:hypothetical protein [Treponema sp.]